MISIEIEIDDLLILKRRIYSFSRTFDQFQICDSNQTRPALDIGKYELIAGFGVKSFIRDLESLEQSGTWKFGWIEYPDNWNDSVGEIRFFEPEWIFCIKKNSNVLKIISDKKSTHPLFELYDKLIGHDSDLGEMNLQPGFTFDSRTSKSQYIETVEKIRNDIRMGVFYEMNYCIEFNANWNKGSLLPFMWRLNERSSAPFAVYARSGDKEILCSSPERFLTRINETLYSQPIKGTNGLKTGDDNLLQMQLLKESEKERAENVMIVDLVRNDLAHVCRTGSIQVLELFGTYPFKTLNHMISTVKGTLEDKIRFSEIIRALFPMGSMTGAPKIEVMKHIDEYENHDRGIYSGCMGYMTPDGDFDFNVMIRTLVYDSNTNNINYKVGSAITYDSIAELEYQECLLKGEKLEKLFV